MSGLLIVGAGGHGKVVAETAEALGRWARIAFLDDRHAGLDGTLRWPVLGAPAEASRWLGEYDAATIAVGYSATRLRLLELMRAQGFALPALVHPTAWVSPSARLGEGCVVFAQAVIQADAVLGRGVIVNTSASVDHDCRLGDGVHLCPGARLAGEVVVGAASWIGIGSSVIQQINIGANVTIGAGAVVIGNIESGCVAVGVPARIIKKQES
jgi:sugar O-acyltransferase (sialic acid O-acetyltransferase NeuD family)